jgi:hypothetical protein
MNQDTSVLTQHEGRIYFASTLVKGKPTQIPCVDIDGNRLTLERGLIRTIRLEDEWFYDIRDPEELIKRLTANKETIADIFTFWQRYPETTPEFKYFLEWDDIAVLPISSYENWISHQIKPRVRGLIKKSLKEGIVVKESVYDEAFVQGMTAIFNESPVRQGRRFWHYGKDYETVRKQFSRHLDRETMIGAYLGDELIGFIMLGDAGRYCVTGQIISSIKHRDKATNNLLIAKAVEICATRGKEALIYLFWSEDSLSEFKRRCGFQRTQMPRYFVPLTMRGRVALHLNLHRGVKNAVPPRLIKAYKALRRKWNEYRNMGE